MIRLTNKCRFLLFLFSTILIVGCATTDGGKGVVSEIKEMFEGTYTVDPYMEKNKPRTIAVLPFVDQSKSQEGTEIVRRGFYNHFSSLAYRDMELVQVDHLLKKAGVYDPDRMSRVPPERFKEILNVDAVVYGTISNFDKLFAGIYSQVSVGAEIKMVDTNGHFLWRGQHVVNIREGSLPTSPIGLISSIISAAMNVRDIQLLRACDDLFRDMVKTIPVAEAAAARKPPVISLLAQDSRGLPKKSGDEINVFLKGTPGLTAWFDIGDTIKGIDMEEVEPGGYVGTYRVIPGDNLDGAIITGYLDEGIGNPTRWVDALGTVTLDTKPPEAPQNGIALGRDHHVRLQWDENDEKDLAGYILFKSDTPLSGFKQLGKTEFTYFEDDSAVNLQAGYYRIAAIDKAGNESIKQLSVTGIAVPPGPTPVSGEIQVDTTWYAGASPYIIEDTVIISENALLTIEPGTRIISNGKGLVVHGQLVAGGGEERLITFDANPDASWGGIAFERVKEGKSIVEYARIKGAAIGILCKSSSPTIRSNEFVGNDVGLKVSGGYSQPTIEKNVIRDSLSVGMMVLDSAVPVITQNQIKNNRHQGIYMNRAGTVFLKGNTIIDNGGVGIAVHTSQVTLTGNNIYNNQSFNIEGDMVGNAVTANGNWWGSREWQDILKKASGRVLIESILDSPSPDGKTVDFPVLQQTLQTDVSESAVLLLANSPYRISGEINIDSGAILYIQPGVKIQYDQQASIVVKDGGIEARGNKTHPIWFTASSSSPSPGDYMNAVRFTQETNVSSSLRYCVFQYATTALDIQFGMPEIVYSHISDCAQSGIRCANDAAPRVLYNTIERNLGTGGIECVGYAKPKINNNNFKDNTVAIQAFSTILIDARHNFWGASPPDKRLFFGDNINIEPWLEAPEQAAFCITCDK